jgi:hypothetical protein
VSVAAAPETLTRDLGLALWQVRYEQRAFWRNRARAFFAFLMPIMFLLIFGSIYHGQRTGSENIPYDDYFVPGILTYGVIATTFINIAISTAILRDNGVLKRMRGTPLPRWTYIAGRVGSATVTTLEMTVLTLVIGWLGYGVHLRGSTLPGLLIALALRDRVLHDARDRHRPLHRQRRRRAGDRQHRDPAAHVHLRRVVRHQPDRRRTARYRIDLSDPRARGRDAVRLQPAHDRRRHQRRRSRHARDLARRRCIPDDPLPTHKRGVIVDARRRAPPWEPRSWRIAGSSRVPAGHPL